MSLGLERRVLAEGTALMEVSSDGNCTKICFSYDENSKHAKATD
jgi:hypothetical protein